MTIKAITFDFWATLYRPRPVDLNQRLRQLKENLDRHSDRAFPLEQIKQAVNVARQTWDVTWAEAQRTIGAAEWLEVVLAELDTHLPPEQLAGIHLEMENNILAAPPDLVPEARQTLADLASRYRLAIISDTGITPGRVLRQILRQDGIIDYFTHLTFSDEIGRSKPHPSAFHTTLTALEVTPAAAVHVGDLLRTDIAGAQGVGMRGVQYIGVSQDDWSVAVETQITPDAVIRSHTELSVLVTQWSGLNAV
ncbi:MAG: HAD family hydrolase [Anaerolineae bacterium]|nr:HAD family hydrolase [Anaerolineae bacterium]